MENPHEQQQSALLRRITANVSKLNHNMMKINDKIEQINKDNIKTEQMSLVWVAYNNSIKIHLNQNK